MSGEGYVRTCSYEEAGRLGIIISRRLTNPHSFLAHPLDDQIVTISPRGSR